MGRAILAKAKAIWIWILVFGFKFHPKTPCLSP